MEINFYKAGYLDANPRKKGGRILIPPKLYEKEKNKNCFTLQLNYFFFSLKKPRIQGKLSVSNLIFFKS